MFKRLGLALILSTLLGFPVFSQEITPEVTEEPLAVVIVEEEAAVIGTLEDPTEVEQDANETLTENALFLAFVAPLVFVLTAGLKRLPFLASTPSARIGLILNIIAWISYVIAKEYGAAAQFETFVSGATTILGALLGVTLTGAGATTLHKQAAASGIPVLGHQRSTPPL